MRPDRITTALNNFIKKTLPNGQGYVESDAKSNSREILDSAFSDSNQTIPIFFILSAGADPLKDVEWLCRK